MSIDEEMVDIVRESARFMDESIVTSSNIIGIVGAGQNTLASNYAAQEDAWLVKLDSYIEFWEN